MLEHCQANVKYSVRCLYRYELRQNFALWPYASIVLISQVTANSETITVGAVIGKVSP